MIATLTVVLILSGAPSPTTETSRSGHATSEPPWPLQPKTPAFLEVPVSASTASAASGPHWVVSDVVLQAIFGTFVGGAVGVAGGYFARMPWANPELSPWSVALPAALMVVGTSLGATIPIVWMGAAAGGRGSFWRTLGGAALGSLMLPVMLAVTYLGIVSAGLPLVIVGGLFAVLSLAAPAALGQEHYVKSHREAVSADAPTVSVSVTPAGLRARF